MEKKFTFEQIWQLNQPAQQQHLTERSEEQLNVVTSEMATQTTSEYRDVLTREIATQTSEYSDRLTRDMSTQKSEYNDRLAREKLMESLQKSKQEISRARVNLNLTLGKEESKIAYHIGLLKKTMKRENEMNIKCEYKREEKKIKKEMSEEETSSD